MGAGIPAAKSQSVPSLLTYPPYAVVLSGRWRTLPTLSILKGQYNNVLQYSSFLGWVTARQGVPPVSSPWLDLWMRRSPFSAFWNKRAMQTIIDLSIRCAGQVSRPRHRTTWISRLQEMGLAVEGALRTGAVAAEIVDAAHGFDVDLIALSSHGYGGLSNWTVGSVAQKMLQRTQRSTF